jgi:hypothetical protein
MASLAHFSREERLGLGIAAMAHVALVAALVWQVRDDPTALPIPERMTVSLADEVSLESTAPDPSAEPAAAAAPVLAPEPEPIEPEPVREQVRPTPRETVAPRPTARPTQRTTPRSSPSRQAGGTRLGDDFLEGAGASQRGGTPAATFGPAEQASLSQAINRQLKPHWSAPSGVDAELLITVLRWELNPDGTLKGRPQIVSQSGITDSNRPQAALHAERAIRAVQLAAPFDLPEEFYDRWRRIREWRFDRRL